MSTVQSPESVAAPESAARNARVPLPVMPAQHLWGVARLVTRPRGVRRGVDVAVCRAGPAAGGVFFYLEDRERTLDSPTNTIMLSLTAFADELEHQKARQRTRDAMLREGQRLACHRRGMPWPSKGGDEQPRVGTGPRLARRSKEM